MQVLIADEIVRRGVRSILESRQDVETVGEAANGREAVERAAELHPDLIILDHSMPILDGLAAVSEIRQILPNVPILMLSMHDGQALIDALQLVGAQGFVPKGGCADKLLEGVDTVLRGETFFKQEPSARRGLHDSK